MLTVYSIQGSPGASTTAMHLAANWALEGREILLIEADPAGGSLSHNLGIQFTPGSASFVASGLPVQSNHLIDHAQDVLFENLHVMPAPASPTGARGIFNTFADFSEELRTISENEMAVIIDGGRITTDTAASGLTTGAAGVVVVCRNNSQLSSLDHLKDMLAAGLGEGGPQGYAVTVGKSPMSPEEWQESCGLTFCGSIEIVADMATDLSAYLARSKRKSKKWRASLEEVGEKLYPYAQPPVSNRPRRPAAAASPDTEVGGGAGQATRRGGYLRSRGPISGPVSGWRRRWRPCPSRATGSRTTCRPQGGPPTPRAPAGPATARLRRWRRSTRRRSTRRSPTNSNPAHLRTATHLRAATRNLRTATPGSYEQPAEPYQQQPGPYQQPAARLRTAARALRTAGRALPTAARALRTATHLRTATAVPGATRNLRTAGRALRTTGRLRTATHLRTAAAVPGATRNLRAAGRPARAPGPGGRPPTAAGDRVPAEAEHEAHRLVPGLGRQAARLERPGHDGSPRRVRALSPAVLWQRRVPV